MQFLVVSKLRGSAKDTTAIADATPIELGFEFCHLAEVSLARQSSEMAQKDQQQVFAEVIAQRNSLAAQIEQRQVFKSNFSMKRSDRRS